MNYIIVKDHQTVLLGPMPWRQRMFQREINDLLEEGDISEQYTIPPISPESNYLALGEGLEIFPVTSSDVPAYDPIYEQLSGPFYSYANNEATETYNAIPVSIEQSKASLKSIATGERYVKEIGGFKITIQETEVTVDTTREGRQIFLDTYLAMSDVETINWKFPEAWISVTKDDMGQIVFAGKSHIQDSFDWELAKHNEIDAAQTVEELQAIVIVETPEEEPILE
jgi:hypothetical protein